jgi:hypothetical protein
MTKNQKIFMGIGIGIAALLVYNKFIKKDEPFIIEGEVDGQPRAHGTPDVVEKPTKVTGINVMQTDS